VGNVTNWYTIQSDGIPINMVCGMYHINGTFYTNNMVYSTFMEIIESVLNLYWNI